MLQISQHALSRSGERAGLTISEAQEMLKAANTVQLNDPSRHPEFAGFRLFYHDDTGLFFVAVYAFSINDSEFRPTAVKTVLHLDWYERDNGAVSDNKKAQAVVKALSGRPVAIRACLDLLGLNRSGHRRFLVCSPTGKKSEIRLKGSVCSDFFMSESVEDICKHPGVLTRLREGCVDLGFALEDRRWIRFAGGSVSEPLHRLNYLSSEPCGCCGAAPLSTDLPMPERRARALSNLSP